MADMTRSSTQAHWHCLFPGLCGPFPKDTPTPDSAALQQLARLLGSAQSHAAANDFHTQLAELSGWPQPLPVAALRLHAGSEQFAGQHVLQLAPVHLHADMDHAILYDEHALQLLTGQRVVLRETLNAHFSEDGLDIIEDEAGHWYLVSEQAFDIDTTALHQVIGRNVNFFLPRGEQASKWKRFLNEAQMLLHMSAVNQQRESRGELSANSLWLWGQGALPSSPPQICMQFVADESLLKGMAGYHGQECLPLSQFSQIDGDALLCDSRLLSAASYGDVERWQQQLAVLIDELLAPMIELARTQRARLTVYPCHGRAYTMAPAGRWQGWRKWWQRAPSPQMFFCRDE